MEAKRREDVMFKTILWATDGSANADRALPVVKELGEAEGSTLIVAHCREVLTGRAAGLPVNADEDELLAKIRKQAAELESVGFHVRVEVATTSGTNAGRVIARIAQTDGADVIVVGTRGHSPLVGTLLGSVTQHLLHVAPCPVLAVPTGEHATSAESVLTATGAAG
jgi:nucleotide-binding universal stress UspA family protein